MKEAELSDGTILEFPDNTPDSVIESKVKEMATQSQAQGPSASSPFSGLGEFFGGGGSAGDVAKSVGNELLAESPVIAGATGGAIAGGSIGGPAAPITATLGALAGGTVGALSKEAVEQGLIRLGIIEEGDTLVSDIPIKKKSLQEGAEDVQKTGLVMGAGEGVGQAAIQPLIKGKAAISQGLGKTVTPQGRETLELFKGTGIVPNPAKVGSQRVLDIFSNIGEAGVIGGNKFLQNEIKAVDFVDDLIKRSTSGANVSRESLGTLMAEAIEGPTGTLNAFKSASKVLFDRMDDIVGQRFVDTSKIRRASSELLDELSTANIEPTLVKQIEKAGRTSVGPVGLQQTGLRFSEAQDLRSALLSITRKGKGQVSDKAKGAAKHLTGIIDGEMRSVAEATGALKQFEKANKFWKDGMDTFNNTLIDNLVRKDPDAAVQALFTAGREKPVTIRRIKRALKSRDLIREFENSTLKTLIFKSTNEVGDVVPGKLLNQLKQFGGQDGKALQTMFPHGEDKALAKLARVKGVLLKGQPDSTGRLAVQIGQVRALQALAGGALIAGDFEKAGMFILIAPAVISRVFRSPSFLRFVTGEAKKTSKLTNPVTFATRLSALLTKENIEHELVDKRPESAASPFSGLAEQFTQ